MAKESITFPEEKILEVIYVIRKGIATVMNEPYNKNKDISEETLQQLTNQCADLEQYIKS